MKNTLLDIINSDTSYNKCSTRYLYKTNPELWKQIVAKTEFLAESAKPKQRIWHILNDVQEVPKCPITGEELKWFDKDYFKTSSRTARMLLQHQRGDFKNGHSEENNNKRREGNLRAVERGRKYRNPETYKSLEYRKKISDANVRNGATPKNLRGLRRIYYDAVWYFTEQSWKNYFDKINPNRINRSKNALDHIYSIQQGFRDNIPPYIIGHWTNLRVITPSENSSKGMRCDKTQNQLFEDFFR